MIETDRLILRQWQAQDSKPFAEMNADPEVMRYFPSIRSSLESDKTLEYCRMSIAEKGWGFWAVELKERHEFIGFIGLNAPSDSLPFSPCVEIGWRLAQAHWRKGYACEGANAALQFAYEQTDIDEIISMTPVLNLPSMGVMRKIGMSDKRQNFNHPEVPNGHPLSEHVVYSISRSEWLALN